jgi:hypothetical protein
VAAAAAIVADTRRDDQPVRSNPAINRPCPECDALSNERAPPKGTPSGSRRM